MKQLYFFIISVFLIAQASVVKAQTPDFIGITLLELSSSKKSALINFGRLEGLELGDWAYLYIQDNQSQGENHPQFIKVAKAEVIKVHPDRSYWFLREVESYSYLTPGARLVMQLSSNDVRRKIKLRTTKRARAIESSSNKPVPSEIIQGQSEHIAGPRLNHTQIEKREDVQVIENTDYSISKNKHWDPEYEQEVESARLSNPIPNDNEPFKREREDDVFSSTAENSADKINNLKYGKTGLYYEIERDKANLAPDYNSGNSIYQQMIEEELNPSTVSKEAIQKMKREGPMYSASMSDQQLRKFFIQSGIAEERERQRQALGERSGHDITFRYTSALSTHTTAEDPNFQGTDYFISLAYEYQLLQTTPKLRDFALEVELERGVGHYDVGGTNIRMEEGSIKGYLHWYFWNSPTGIKKYLPYLGLGFRRGNAQSYSPDLSKDYDWQFVAFPSWQLGVKYRFRSGDERNELIKLGLGFNFQITGETVRHNTINEVEDNITSSFTTNQLKMSFGIGAYF